MTKTLCRDETITHTELMLQIYDDDNPWTWHMPAKLFTLALYLGDDVWQFLTANFKAWLLKYLAEMEQKGFIMACSNGKFMRVFLDPLMFTADMKTQWGWFGAGGIKDADGFFCHLCEIHKQKRLMFYTWVKLEKDYSVPELCDRFQTYATDIYDLNTQIGLKETTLQKNTSNLPCDDSVRDPGSAPTTQTGLSQPSPINGDSQPTSPQKSTQGVNSPASTPDAKRSKPGSRGPAQQSAPKKTAQKKKKVAPRMGALMAGGVLPRGVKPKSKVRTDDPGDDPTAGEELMDRVQVFQLLREHGFDIGDDDLPCAAPFLAAGASIPDQGTSGHKIVGTGGGLVACVGCESCRLPKGTFVRVPVLQEGIQALRDTPNCVYPFKKCNCPLCCTHALMRITEMLLRYGSVHPSVCLACTLAYVRDVHSKCQCSLPS